jgi:phytoene dehydrogenase-like protein
MAKHYDVVVLGAGIGALSAAALLARRSWRVLVLGQGHHAATYSFDGLPLARRSFNFLASASPAWGRVIVELAQSQTFRRRVMPFDPAFQVLSPGRRLEVFSDEGLFGREVDREFPGIRRVVDELYAELGRTGTLADGAFGRDIVVPPGGFWERRETARVFASLPHLDEMDDLLAEFSRDHPYRGIMEITSRFASDLADTPPPFAIARLHGAWLRGAARLARGEEELSEFLVERVRAHGGDVNLSERASAITHRGGKVTGVILDGDDAATGVEFVVSDLPTTPLLDLAVGFAPSRRAMTQLPAAHPRAFRFVVSILARTRGVPERLAHESFLLPEGTGYPVHLQRIPAGDGATMLVAETFLESDSRGKVAGARERVLATVEHFLPFVERHYLLVDSSHDGRPLWDFRSGSRKNVDRTRTRPGGGSLEAESMIPQWDVDPLQLHGLAGEPLRTPLGGAFVVGKTALPALGQEGELLAAWGAARIITRTDRRKEKMRRDMWSKVELG